MRGFEQIISEEKQTRNIIEISLTKIQSTDENGEIARPRSLSFEELGELIFDVLQIKAEECLAINFNTGHYDQREIKMKPEVNVSQYLRYEPFVFKDHNVTVNRQSQNVTRVSFKNVPLNVPDEEILNLCLAYGKPLENKVSYETLNIKRGKTLTGSTRYVDMQMEEGKTFMNYYWMEGPLAGDQGKRIVVLHSNQPPQCSHCLKRSSEGCPALGVGKACERSGTPKAKMKEYMENLRKKTGYVSLKIKYAEKQARMFPSLLGLPGEIASEQEVGNLWSMEDKENNEDPFLVTNSNDKRDSLISEQQSKL